MNEIKLIEEIEDAIHNKKYDELLYKVELKLKKLFYKYTTEDVLTLINRTIIFHNYNIHCKEENYSEYQRDKHVSLKILLSLPEYYYKNISEKGKDSIYDYTSVIDELVGIIAELECVYYYYPYKNKKDFMLNNEKQFYMNYFKSYYFDYPAIEIRDFLEFFKSNINLCEEVLDDNNFKESLELMLYLQEFESNLRKEKLSLNLLFDKDIRRIINSENIYILYPLRTVKKICRKKKINFKTFMKNYAFDLEDNEKKESNLIDILAKSKDKRFMFITSKFLFFPRNYYWMYKMYDIVWRSANISKKIDYGKTIKSLMHLKRTGRQYAEKDFVIFYQNKILSFEAKSNLLPKPELDDSIDNVKLKCEECIRKAYAQSLEVKQKVMSGTAVFYDGSNKKNNVVLDLRNSKVDECLQIIVMYEEYLGIETNIEHICPDFDAWIIDIKNLKFILADTIGKGKFERLIDYAKKRKNAYGLVDVQSGEELKVYNLYKSMPIFFEYDCKDRGISVHI